MNSSTTETEEMISVLFNNCYGGWRPSQKAYDLYNQLKTPNTTIHLDDLPRHDPLLIEIFHELGRHTFDHNKYSETVEFEIPKKYLNYYTVRECPDGYEIVVIDKAQFKLDNIIQILQKNISNDDKIAEIENVTLWE